MPPRLASSIAILETAPTRPYRGLARIEVRDRGLGRSEERLRKKLIAKAADLGADAVITEPAVTRRAFGWFVLFDDKVLAGTAVIYVEATPKRVVRSSSPSHFLVTGHRERNAAAFVKGP